MRKETQRSVGTLAVTAAIVTAFLGTSYAATDTSVSRVSGRATPDKVQSSGDLAGITIPIDRPDFPQIDPDPATSPLPVLDPPDLPPFVDFGS
jgi:hypothetical protein